MFSFSLIIFLFQFPIRSSKTHICITNEMHSKITSAHWVNESMRNLNESKMLYICLYSDLAISLRFHAQKCRHREKKTLKRNIRHKHTRTFCRMLSNRMQRVQVQRLLHKYKFLNTRCATTTTATDTQHQFSQMEKWNGSMFVYN